MYVRVTNFWMRCRPLWEKGGYKNFGKNCHLFPQGRSLLPFGWRY